MHLSAGRGGSNFKELQEKTKLTRLNVDKSSNEVILVGTKTSVEAAKLYMETHLQYLQACELRVLAAGLRGACGACLPFPLGYSVCKSCVYPESLVHLAPAGVSERDYGER